MEKSPIPISTTYNGQFINNYALHDTIIYKLSLYLHSHIKQQEHENT